MKDPLPIIMDAVRSPARPGSLRDRWLMARASYAYSRYRGLTVAAALRGAISLFFDTRLRIRS